MKRKVTALTDVEVRKAKAREKDYKLADGKGLYLLVSTSGGKYWRCDYSFQGKRKTLAFGTYPETTLTLARDRRAAARELLAAGIDPAVDKQEKAAKRLLNEATFQTVALEWLANCDKSKDHVDRMQRYAEKYLFPAIGGKPLVSIETPELYQLCKGVSLHSAYTAQRLKSILEQVFVYAIINGKAKTNPAVSLKGTLPTVNTKHFAAPTTAAELAPILKAIDAFTGSYILKQALYILPQLLIRPGNLREMEWSEIDLEAATWIIPAEKMKMGNPHITPLSRQVVAVLREISALTGSGRYVFPNHRTLGDPLSHNAFNEAFRRMGFTHNEIVAHGFRATARTMLHEVLKFQPDVIEAQLAHKVPDRLGNAYNRAKHLDDRIAMMQAWSDHLDQLKTEKVVELRKAAA